MTRPAGPLRELGPALKACLTAGVPGVAPALLNADALTPDLGEILMEGLAPIALRLVETGSEDPGSSIRKQLARVTMLQQMRSLAADAVLDRVFDILDGGGIRFVVIKGPAVARLHPEGWPRPYADIDLLVEPRRFASAMTLLLQNGFVYPVTSQPPWPWFDKVCREGLNLGGPGDVDLHHHVAPWVVGRRLGSTALIDDADIVEIRGRAVRLASPENSAVIASLHILNDLWKGQRGLVSWRDLLVIIRGSGVEQVQQAFARVGLGWLFNATIRDLDLELPGLVGASDRAARLQFRHAWRMKGLGWNKSSSLSRQRLAWAIRLPVPQAVAFVVGSAFPSRRYVRDRHGSYRDYWRQAWTETVSTFAGADHRLDKRPMRDGSPS